MSVRIRRVVVAAAAATVPAAALASGSGSPSAKPSPVASKSAAAASKSAAAGSGTRVDRSLTGPAAVAALASRLGVSTGAAQHATNRLPGRCESPAWTWRG